MWMFQGDLMDYLIISGAVLSAIAFLWLGGLLTLCYLLRYKSVPSIYLATNDRFQEVANGNETPVLTVANGRKLEPASRVLFFPDLKGPCASYIKSFEPNAGRVKCFKKDCDMFHYNDVRKSSFMTIMERLRGARQVDLCMYRISIKEASDVLISLHQSGARVRIITDLAEVDFSTDQVPRLKSSGIEVREITFDSTLTTRERPLMHNKFVIIDQRVCFSGSFNWTWKAMSLNQEMVIECYDRSVVQPLVSKFNQLWRSYAASSSLSPTGRPIIATSMVPATTSSQIKPVHQAPRTHNNNNHQNQHTHNNNPNHKNNKKNHNNSGTKNSTTVDIL